MDAVFSNPYMQRYTDTFFDELARQTVSALVDGDTGRMTNLSFLALHMALALTGGHVKGGGLDEGAMSRALGEDFVHRSSRLTAHLDAVDAAKGKS